MANSKYNFREVRMVYEDDVTHCYVYLEALGDCPIYVQGWHYKAFPASVPGCDIFENQVLEAIKWPLAAPKAWGKHD